MPRKGYINPKQTNLGKGNHMEPKLLKDALLKACKHRPSELERLYNFKHGTACRLCKKVKELGLNEDKLNSMTSKEAHALYYKKQKPIESIEKNKIEPNLELLEQQYNLSKVKSHAKLKLTRELTIEEYYFNDPKNKELVQAGTHIFYSKSHILTLWRNYRNTIVKPTYARQHVLGDEAEYDFTGVKLPYTEGGIEKYATILVATLTGSGHIYVKAIENQSLPAVCNAIADSFRFWGGCPNVIRIDNFKAACVQAGRYQGIYTEDFYKLTSFFNVDIHSCRVRKATDKGSVEACVKYTTRYALAKANHRIVNGLKFNSLNEINSFLKPLINDMNNRRIRGRSKSRQEVFEQYEKPLLHQPISWDYSYDVSYSAKVAPNCRILYNEHQYALPIKWIGEQVTVTITSTSIRITQNSHLIASYPRKDFQKGVSAYEGYILDEHLSFDIFCIENQENLLLEWASNIGPNVYEWCHDMLYKNKQTYSDKVRLVNKLLSIPNANVLDYERFNLCVKEACISSLHKVTCHEIIKKWERCEQSTTYSEDPLYNNKNYRTIIIDYITCKSSSIDWSLKKQNLSYNDDDIAPKEFLNGHELYATKYAHVSNYL